MSTVSLRGVALAAALLLPAAAGAQGGLSGSIYAAGSADPLSGASVVVVGTARGAIADTAGRFQIHGLTPGRYEVEARMIGRAEVRVAATVRDGEVTTLRLSMGELPADLAGIRVVGRRSDAMARLPGSAAVVSPATIATIQPVSANDVLRRIPGVHVQEEEGGGMRVNIGIRGLDPDRSRTVLVLEDGVPVALAPYGEPEMYYSPPIDRMERVEVIKGSGSILFGPQTVGGIVNFVTADPPAEPAGRASLHGGTGDSRLLKLRYGGSWGNAGASGGIFRRSVDDWNGLHFDIIDFTGKLAVRTGSGDLGVKLSVYDEASNSTYVGLTDSLFRAEPHRHPAPGDRLDIRRYAVTGTHELPLGTGRSLRTAVYGYTTSRDWMRRDYTYTASGNAHEFRNSTGNRNRAFEVLGIEPRLRTIWALGSLNNELETGVRAHVERARDQHINGTTATASTGVVRDDEVRTGRALSAFAQNRIFLTDAFQLTPGVRVERFEFDRRILRTRIRRESGETVTNLPEDVNIRSGDDLLEVIPGLGASWSPGALLTVFAGAHRGFAPPRTKDALIYENPTLPPDAQVPAPVSLELDAERSWNYELGVRMHPVPSVSLEATAFHLDFSNQIIEPSLSSGSVSQAQLANQGQTLHSGLEAALAIDLGKLVGQPFGLTTELAYTYVDARFAGERLMQRAPGDTANVEGNRLPYAPRDKASASLMLDHPWGLMLRLDGTWVGAQFSDNFETVEGSANGRVGRIPAYRFLDLSAEYRHPRLASLTLRASAKNLTDAVYIASRRPEGIKPGLPRLITVGVDVDF
ncbi:MAG TPA: TonB-dependent receptor [Gemmatimonadaceae bacterium]|nr:TonB-dependent receptor [Gemmatimonadaceae bacterium]